MKDDDQMDAYLIKAFRAKGYKATPQRIAIGRFALLNQNHPTTRMIYSEVKRSYPTVSLSTVYKTIKILEDVGLVQELNFPNDQTRLDSSMEPHINLVCLNCGAIRDARSSCLQDMLTQVSMDEDFNVKGHRFDVYGLCRSCRTGAPQY